MDAVPNSPQPDRPPGGTRRAGNKTPRKVQWVVGPSESHSDPEVASRALDEHGLNPEAFETLTTALERHRESPSEFPFPPQSNPVRSADPPQQDEYIPEETPHISPTLNLNGNYIDPDETAGLPGVNAEEAARQQASRVVQSHQMKHGFFGKFYSPRRNRAKHASQASSDVSDIEKTADIEQHRNKIGNGVLGALLTLYDQHSSGTSTPARSSFDDSRPPSMFGMGEDAGSGATSSSLKAPNHPWTHAFSRSESRPQNARSAAGVFGPLIASTGNIAGAAAPQASTIGPNVKRPGYHLSRYSLESNLPKASRDDKGEKSDKSLSRPQSAVFEGSPLLITTSVGSTVSPGESPGNDSSSGSLTLFNTGSRTGTGLSSINGRNKWSHMIKDLPKRGWNSRSGTPSTPGTPIDEIWREKRRAHEEQKKERHRKRKTAEIFITRHVAEILQRQEFIMKLTRAMMMFGGPTHRLQAQIQATARVLEIELSCMYLPDVMLISFEDSSTSTSNLKLIRQASALDLGKLQDANKLYWKVIHDEVSVKDASVELDELMKKPPLYCAWKLIIIGGCCSSAICSVSFNGSFIDSLMSWPLGALLIIIQLVAARNELYSNVFEITVATLLSFISAALASTNYFCYSALASSAVVLILPGFIVLCGSLELSSRNIVSGAVRLCFALMYSLFLGFGLAMGGTAYEKITGIELRGNDDVSCQESHSADGPWYQRTPSLWWAFLTVPLYSLFLSLRNHAPWNHKEIVLLVAISSVGWVTNHFTGTKFPNQADISAAVGALSVGIISNIYGRFFRGNAFVVMITGILFQLPSGLANGGLFTFASQKENGSSSTTSYLSGFQTALQLIAVSVGLTVGLGIATVIVYPVPSRRRAGGVFSL